MAITPIATVPNRSDWISRKYEKNDGKMENNASQSIRFENIGEIENIYKPNANKADAFLVESFISFTWLI